MCLKKKNFEKSGNKNYKKICVNLVILPFGKFKIEYREILVHVRVIPFLANKKRFIRVVHIL